MSLITDTSTVFDTVSNSNTKYEYNLLPSHIIQQLRKIVKQYSKATIIDEDNDNDTQTYLDTINTILHYTIIPDTLYHTLADTYTFHSESIATIQYNIELQHTQACILLQLLDLVYIEFTQYLHTQCTTIKPKLKIDTQIDTVVVNTILLCLQYTMDKNQFRSNFTIHRDEQSNRDPYEYCCEWLTNDTVQYANTLLHTIAALYCMSLKEYNSKIESIQLLYGHYIELCIKQLLHDIKQYDIQQRKLDKFDNTDTKKQYWYTHSYYKLILLQLCKYSTKTSIQSILHIFVSLTVTLLADMNLFNKCIGCMCMQYIVQNTTTIQLQWYKDLLIDKLQLCLSYRDIELTELLLPVYINCCIKLNPHISIHKHQQQLHNAVTDNDKATITKQYESMLKTKQTIFEPILSELRYLALSPSKNEYNTLIIYTKQLQRLISYMQHSLIQYFKPLIPILFTYTTLHNAIVRTQSLQCIVLLLHCNSQRMLYHTTKLFEQCCTVYLYAYNQIQCYTDQIHDENDSDNTYINKYVQQQDIVIHDWKQTQYHAVQLLLLLRHMMHTHKRIENRPTFDELVAGISDVEELKPMLKQLDVT